MWPFGAKSFLLLAAWMRITKRALTGRKAILRCDTGGPATTFGSIPSAAYFISGRPVRPTEALEQGKPNGGSGTFIIASATGTSTLVFATLERGHDCWEEACDILYLTGKVCIAR